MRTCEFKWIPFAKGGEYSPYYSDIHLVVNWENKGNEIINLVDKNGKLLSRPQNISTYFKNGITWSRRTTSQFSIRVFPKGAIYADKGPVAFSQGEDYLILALFQSSLIKTLISLQLGAADAAARSYNVGIINSIPIPEIISEKERLMQLSRNAINILRLLDTRKEISHIFWKPSLLFEQGRNIRERIKIKHELISTSLEHINEIQNEIDELVYLLYGVDNKLCDVEEEPSRNHEEEEDPSNLEIEESSMVKNLISWCVGVSFGRFDIRTGISEKEMPDLLDPFNPLPTKSPGMLDVLPIDYPIDLPNNGILIQEDGNSENLKTRLITVLELIYDEPAEIEMEICEILKIRNIESYLQKHTNGGFWMDHVQRYSKSRRKAPIYWYLRSNKGNYGLWLYYHRLDKDMYYKALTNYVEPKVRLEEGRLQDLKTQLAGSGEGGTAVKRLEKDIAKQEEFVSELYDFRDKLKKVAELNLEPDLDDGVVLNIAPLHELVPWNEAEKYWKELMDGQYEWSTISKQLKERGLI